MNCNVKISTNPSVPLNSCNHTQQTAHGSFIYISEKVSALALGIFSFYKNWSLFVPFFCAGICIGIYSHINKESLLKQPGSSCTSSLLEQITGAKLPPIISLGVNTASTFCHIKCHGKFFVPIIGVSLGNGIGNALVRIYSL